MSHEGAYSTRVAHLYVRQHLFCDMQRLHDALLRADLARSLASNDNLAAAGVFLCVGSYLDVGTAAMKQSGVSRRERRRGTAAGSTQAAGQRGNALLPHHVSQHISKGVICIFIMPRVSDRQGGEPGITTSTQRGGPPSPSTDSVIAVSTSSSTSAHR
jgi:hypothetical protein